jgi:hypothetical protein
MNSQLFIPQKIKVGYQERSDTYTKKLAYVIYYDQKGVLRKELSFEEWRDKKIPTDEYENKPKSGFHLNKGILRDGYWSNGHNMVRIYDDRGIEFEITVGNLLFILMTTNCSKRELEGEFVYAWSGKELVLLPTDCEEYKKSQGFTSLQGQKVKGRDLKPGYTYLNKRQENLLYLGRFDFFQTAVWDNKEIKETTLYKNSYVFYNEKNNNVYSSNGWVQKTSVDDIAKELEEAPAEEFAATIDNFLKSEYSGLVEAIHAKIINIISHHFSYKKVMVERYKGESYARMEKNFHPDILDQKPLLEISSSVYGMYNIYFNENDDSNLNGYINRTFTIKMIKVLSIENGIIYVKDNKDGNPDKKVYTLKELNDIGSKNGKKYNLK